MHRLSEDIWHIPLTPRNAINAYVVGDVLVDAGVALNVGQLRRAVAGHGVRAHALTHAHVDHAGSSKALAAELSVPVWIGAGDAADARRGRPTVAPGRLSAIVDRGGRFPAVAIDRELHEGDDLGHGFVVLDTPGHSPGHVSYWRERDRTLICGDVINTMNLLTTVRGLHEPPRVFSTDPAQNRASIRRIAALQPALVLAGHGPPLRDPAALSAFAAGVAA